MPMLARWLLLRDTVWSSSQTSRTDDLNEKFAPDEEGCVLKLQEPSVLFLAKVLGIVGVIEA